METIDLQHSEPERRRLLALFDAASPAQKTILELLALLGQTVYKPTLLQYGSALNLKDQSGRIYNAAALSGALDELHGSDLIVKIGAHGPIGHIDYKCPHLLSEVLIRKAAQEDRLVALVKAIGGRRYPGAYHSMRSYPGYQAELRYFRIAYYSNDQEELTKELGMVADDHESMFRKYHPYFLILTNPFDPRWLENRPAELIVSVFSEIFRCAFINLFPVGDVLAYLQGSWKNFPEPHRSDLRVILARQLFLTGRRSEVRDLLEPHTGYASLALDAVMDFLDGEDSQAVPKFKKALELCKKETGKRKPPVFPDFEGFFYPLALLRSPDAGDKVEAQEFALNASTSKNSCFNAGFNAIYRLCRFRRGLINTNELNEAYSSNKYYNFHGAEPINRLFEVLTNYWIGRAKLVRPAPQRMDFGKLRLAITSGSNSPRSSEVWRPI